MPNVFQNGASTNRPEFDAASFFEDAYNSRTPSLKQFVLAHADEEGLRHAITSYGVYDANSGEPERGRQIPDFVYPDATKYGKYPLFYNDNDEWVKVVLNGVTKSPSSRLKTLVADMTRAGRAKGYNTGDEKTPVTFPVMNRETYAKTIHIKQEADRDDILDITDFDYVAMLRESMRIKFAEEKARAILFGDGRDDSNPEKISEECIRPVVKDDEFYTIDMVFPFNNAVNTDPNARAEFLTQLVDAPLAAMTMYQGSGNLTAFMGYKMYASLMTRRDSLGHRFYHTADELAAEMGFNRIVTTPYAPEWLGVALDLKDYTIGAYKGGNDSMFDDFDIDFNRYKYLLECRCCGSLLKPKSAIVFGMAGAPIR